jgi:DNA-binding HxlR family transcriptional regulator
VQTCTGTRALELLGERWTFLILRESMAGVRRFTDLQRNLGIARNILAARLRTLVAEGLLERERHAYVLTERGRALYPAIQALMRWGGEHLADEPCDCPECAR